jgi:FlaA1/EpsC-like NDP-sugar epimerase
MFENKVFLIFGGTGSLGYAINKRYLHNNIIHNFSRDEQKHWKMNIDFDNHNNMHFVIGNVSNKDKVKEAIYRINPNIIIIASAMKHIDQCEINIGEIIET